MARNPSVAKNKPAKSAGKKPAGKKTADWKPTCAYGLRLDKKVFAIVLLAILCAVLLAFALNSSPAQKLRVITEDFSPYNFVEDGEVVGPSTRVVKEIMRRAGTDAQIEVLSWDDGYNLALNTPNVALYSTLRTSVREGSFKWVGPIAEAKTVFFLPAISSFAVGSLDDARQLASICVMKEDAAYQVLKAQGFTNLMIGQNDIDCLQKLSRGEAASWVGIGNSLEFMAERAGVDPAMFVPEYVLSTDPMYIAFSMGTPDEVVKKWQDALDAMKADGTFAAMAG